YILKGKLKVQLDDKVEVLTPGDSLMYDSSHPHGMIAIGDEPCEFLAVVLRGSGDAPVAAPSPAAGSGVAPVQRRQLLYQDFMSETLTP
ncbi:MAG: cupin domain-containing protein, partial [Lentisphaeria bacterium]|nr:cupin domain-containing protein [Lentisphaeria bacterium]